VTVRSERPPGDGEAERATVVVEREPSSRDAGTATPTVVGRPDDGPDRLLPEQAMRARGLRNTLPFFTEGVETVRLETTGTVASRTARVVRFGASQGGFRFEGTVYGFRVGAGEAPTEAGADTAATSTPFGRSPAGK
jgi:hypothetical protein